MSAFPQVESEPAVAPKVSTPVLLRVSACVICVLALLCFLAVRSEVNEHRAGMKTIGVDAAPSIIEAQKIRANLADMHANTANALLHPPGKYDKTLSDYEKRRVQATKAILEAAGNVTFGKAEREPLLRLLDALGRYEAEAAKAFVLHQRNEKDFMLYHRQADQIMSKEVLPAADDLDKANRKELDHSYATVRGGSLRAIVSTALTGGLLLAALSVVQWFLYRRTRRIMNPALAAATVLALWGMHHSLTTFVSQRTALRTAKEDAFESIHVLLPGAGGSV